MKIKLEDVENSEIEITIKGNLADEKVKHIINLLKSSSVTTKIILFSQEKEILTDISEVLYFEVSSRKVYAKINDTKLVCKYSLLEVLAMFKNRGIVQIGKSLLVNVNFVKSIQAEFSGNYIITLKNDEKLLVSRFYMKEFRNAIMEV